MIHSTLKAGLPNVAKVRLCLTSSSCLIALDAYFELMRRLFLGRDFDFSHNTHTKETGFVGKSRLVNIRHEVASKRVNFSGELRLSHGPALISFKVTSTNAVFFELLYTSIKVALGFPYPPNTNGLLMLADFSGMKRTPAQQKCYMLGQLL